MTILVTGGTGKVGSEVVRHLLGRDVTPRVLVRDATKASLPPGAMPTTGDLTDVGSLRAAFKGIDTLFLLNAAVPDEVTQALTALNLAQEAGIERLVYLSTLSANLMPEVPHVASKSTVERAIAALNFQASVLNTTYFMQNDLALKEAIAFGGVYPMPIGDVGVAVIDVRDLGEVAAHELMRRDSAPNPLPARQITVCGPETLTGPALAARWANEIGRPVAYAGDDLNAFETGFRSQGAPSWLAYELRLMFRAMQKHGQSEEGAAKRVEEILGRPLRTYAAFVHEAAASW